MLISGKNPDELISTMNVEITKVVDWLQINKLSLNLKKTHFIIFQLKRGKINLNENLVINGVNIAMVDRTKFLGVIIDEYLSFQYHIQYIKGKVARGIGILYKCRRFFDQKTLIMLYHAFIYPYFNYCIPVWGNTYISYLDPLIKLQKRGVRIIIGAKRFDHTDPIFKSLKILQFKKLYIYAVQLFLFKYYRNFLPRIFSGYFIQNNSIHEYNTRQQTLYRTPRLRTNFATKFIRLTGVKIFNYFADKISMDCSYLTYKLQLKQYLIDTDISLECL